MKEAFKAVHEWKADYDEALHQHQVIAYNRRFFSRRLGNQMILEMAANMEQLSGTFLLSFPFFSSSLHNTQSKGLNAHTHAGGRSSIIYISHSRFDNKLISSQNDIRLLFLLSPLSRLHKEDREAIKHRASSPQSRQKNSTLDCENVAFCLAVLLSHSLERGV